MFDNILEKKTKLDTWIKTLLKESVDNDQQYATTELILYLLETVQDQEKLIVHLEDRIEDMEDQLDDLLNEFIPDWDEENDNEDQRENKGVCND